MSTRNNGCDAAGDEGLLPSETTPSSSKAKGGDGPTTDDATSASRRLEALEDEVGRLKLAVASLTGVEGAAAKGTRRRERKKRRKAKNEKGGESSVAGRHRTQIVAAIVAPVVLACCVVLGRGHGAASEEKPNLRGVSDGAVPTAEVSVPGRVEGGVADEAGRKLQAANDSPPSDPADADLFDGSTAPRPASAPASSSSSLAGRCPAADNERCGCADVTQQDYRGTANTTVGGLECLRWDAIPSTFFVLDSVVAAFPDAGLVENFCRNPGGLAPAAGCVVNDEDNPIRVCDVPACDPCSCAPPCGATSEANCPCPSVLQIERCCDRDDAACACGYLTAACGKSLENNGTDFCDEAAEACCEGKEDDRGCEFECDLYERVCAEDPAGGACERAAGACCRDFPGGNDNRGDPKSLCLCDFYNYASDVLDYESDARPGRCAEADQLQISSPGLEKAELVAFFKNTGGDYWLNNDGWMDDSVPICQWHGLTCNHENLVVEVSLRNNNLTGARCFKCEFDLRELISLDLSGNNLWGSISFGDFATLRKIERIDISGNDFTGHADIFFSPVTSFVNFSNNNFTSVGFKRFNAARESLKVVDMSNNLINQEASDIFNNIPMNIEELLLSNNEIFGTIPDPFPLGSMRRFDIAHNNLHGPLSNFPDATPQLRLLDVSNQKRTDDGGLNGTLPLAIFKLADLIGLDLSGNKLSQGIPSTIGELVLLKNLNLSSNFLTGPIPPELGKLNNGLKVLDLSNNKLSDQIPSEIGTFRGEVRLKGNKDITNPAPLDLCFLPRFDGINDTKALCPAERNALTDFYREAKGQEWSNSTNWIHPYISHCRWYGVNCTETNNTIKLDLRNNGLSGTLSKEVAALSYLEHLDLSDNNIKGTIPQEIGSLSNLTYLRLSYNSFVETMPNEFQRLSQLTFIQLHGNRLQGFIPLLLDTQPIVEGSSFVADCGVPSIYEDPLACEQCTMCCNGQGDCYPTKKTTVQEAGFVDYENFTWTLFFPCVIGICCILHLASFMYDQYEKRTRPMERRGSTINRDKNYALDTIGKDSVYQFFLGKTWFGWAFALATMAAQVGMLFIFVKGSEFDLDDDNTDRVYTWKCPLDEEKCRDTSDLDWRGWLVFIILMAAHLLKDIINGTKLIVLSAKSRHSNYRRIRFFLGGIFLIVVSSFTCYVTTIYNEAIATSNTEIIENSVIVLFITDVDEMFYRVLTAINPRWTQQASNEEDKWEVVTRQNMEMKNEIQLVLVEMGELRCKMKEMQERMGLEDTFVEVVPSKMDVGADKEESKDESFHDAKESITEKENTCSFKG